MKRTSVVQEVWIDTISRRAVFQVGDNKVIRPLTLALAVQREVPIFKMDEGNFAAYSLFSRPIPLPLVDEDITMTVNNVSPYIWVSCMDIMTVTSAAVMQLGTNSLIQAESRVKHIRQLLHGKMPK